jgi:hypothetical protein
VTVFTSAAPVARIYAGTRASAPSTSPRPGKFSRYKW